MFAQHKPEVCEVKAKAGDTVAVHYTVRRQACMGLFVSLCEYSIYRHWSYLVSLRRVR